MDADELGSALIVYDLGVRTMHSLEAARAQELSSPISSLVHLPLDRSLCDFPDGFQVFEILLRG